MNRALQREMRAMREGMQAEKDLEARALMASMYRDMYGQAFRDEEAERPMRLTRTFVRSVLFYLLLGIGVLALLGYLFGTVIVYMGGTLLLAAIVTFSAISMRNTKTISEDTFKEIVSGAFKFISANKPTPSKLPNWDESSAISIEPTATTMTINADADPQLPSSTGTQET